MKLLLALIMVATTISSFTKNCKDYNTLITISGATGFVAFVLFVFDALIQVIK